MKGFFSIFKESAKEFTKLRSLVVTAMFVALSMVIESQAIDLHYAKLNFAFLAIAVIGMLFGPCMGLVAGLACDIVGYLAHPDGAFLPAYVLVAGLQGLIYGICLYQKMNQHSIQFVNNSTGKGFDITLYLRAIVARWFGKELPAAVCAAASCFAGIPACFPEKDSRCCMMQCVLISNFSFEINDK